MFKARVQAKYRIVAKSSDIGFGEHALKTHDEFWGSEGAGGVFVAKDTGRLLLAYRSAYVNEPHTWGTFGGAIDEGEDPKEALEREIKEETGYTGNFKLTPVWVFTKGSFRFHNFLIEVPKEFKPKLDWETERAEWFDLDKLPDKLHFGLKALLPHLSAFKSKVTSSATYLYHTTSWRALKSILASGTIKARGGFVSLSEKPFVVDISASEVALKLDRAKLKDVEKVAYTRKWFEENEDKASYIAGEGWHEQFTLDGVGDDPEAEAEAYREALFDSFQHKTGEDEWLAEGNVDVQNAIIAVVISSNNFERDKNLAEELAPGVPLDW